MILNDDEIVNSLSCLYDDGTFRRDIYNANKAEFDVVAKTQLKKLVAWGDEDCPEHAVEARKSIRRGLELIGRPPVYPRRECHTCWQSLLEEINE